MAVRLRVVKPEARGRATRRTGRGRRSERSIRERAEVCAAGAGCAVATGRCPPRGPPNLRPSRPPALAVACGPGSRPAAAELGAVSLPFQHLYKENLIEKMSATTEKQGCLSILFRFLRPKAQSDESLPYRLRDDFLSPAEFSFYRVLSLILGSRFTVQSKVRLADIFFVARPNENVAYFNKIAQRHLDFLVCDAVTMKPLLGVELDDTSHRLNSRQERDEFVERVFQAAKLPLLRVPVQREYNAREVAAQIAPFLKDAVATPGASEPASMTAVPLDNAVPLCPKCGIPMVLRTVTQGEHKGKQFYGCANYPRCREITPVPTQTQKAG